MTPTRSPFHFVDTAERLARHAPPQNALAFNRMAMVCMGVMAAASVMQVLQPLLRDLNRHSDRGDRGRGR
jgi:hypothetical protein